LLVGASGLVGKNLLEQLLIHSSYERVIVFVEKTINIESSKLTQYVIDFKNTENYEHLIKADDVFLCPGQDSDKKTSEKDIKNQIYSRNFNFAKYAAINKTGQLFLVSSVGANPNSFLYQYKIKGELERDVLKLPFWAIHIFKPSLLLEDRNVNRFGESIANKIGGFFDSLTGNLLTKYKPIEADIVAKAMILAAQNVSKGIFIHDNEKLQKIAKKTDRFLD